MAREGFDEAPGRRTGKSCVMACIDCVTRDAAPSTLARQNRHSGGRRRPA